MNDNDLKWQTRAEMDVPTNPLQALRESFTRTSKDMCEAKFDAWTYGVIVGYDDDSYRELSKRFEWSAIQIDYNKLLHENYNKAWSLFIANL